MVRKTRYGIAYGHAKWLPILGWGLLVRKRYLTVMNSLDKITAVQHLKWIKPIILGDVQ
jgi:hypothetical protein